MAKHILVSFSWSVEPDGSHIWILDPAWNITQQLDHFGQPAGEIIPVANGFNNELIVDDATALDMETNPLCVLIWSQEAV